MNTAENNTLSAAEREVLIKLVEHGPLDDGELPSKLGRDGLLFKGFAAQAIIGGKLCGTVATWFGGEAYCDLMGKLYLDEAIAKHRTDQTIERMFRVRST